VDPSTLVIFGATGNLSRQKLMPALYQLEVANRLPENMAIVSFGRRNWDLRQWQDTISLLLRDKFHQDVDEQALQRFCERLHFFQGDIN